MGAERWHDEGHLEIDFDIEERGGFNKYSDDEEDGDEEGGIPGLLMAFVGIGVTAILIIGGILIYNLCTAKTPEIKNDDAKVAKTSTPAEALE